MTKREMIELLEEMENEHQDRFAVVLEASYEYLRVSPPFRAWKLPPAEDVGFKVTIDKQVHGRCEFWKGEFTINLADQLGYSTLQIMQMNHDKLKDRRARGKSRGEGDDR